MNGEIQKNGKCKYGCLANQIKIVSTTLDGGHECKECPVYQSKISETECKMTVCTPDKYMKTDNKCYGCGMYKKPNPNQTDCVSITCSSKTQYLGTDG